MFILFIKGLVESLNRLTCALQELTEREMSGNRIKPPLPARIPASIFSVSPEVEYFIMRRQEYMEKTCDVSVGQY